MQNNPYGIESMWLQGDLVIKVVALILLAMSIASWTIIFIRSFRLWKLRKIKNNVSYFWHTENFTEGLKLLGSNTSHNHFRHLAQEGKSAMHHHQMHKDELQGQLPLSDWLTSSLQGAIDESTERMQSGLTVLASVGATAPFVGLFGTVWGIYHALVSIGVSGQASIDKVSGPVGEALIMTAFGLAVAIPAVLGYNALTRGHKSILGQLNRFAQQLHIYFLTGTAPVQHTMAKVSPLKAKMEVS